MFMGGRKDSKFTVNGVDLNGKPCPGRLCPTEIPRPNPGYKMEHQLRKRRADATSTYISKYIWQHIWQQSE